MESEKSKIAQGLLTIGAVGFAVDHPVTFKSGIISPVYVDNRILPSYPDFWSLVIQAWVRIIKDNNMGGEVIAGIESAGIPHSAVLGYVLKKPSVFCRKQVKDHGTKKLIEGGSVEGKQVILVEDLVTTGGSSLAGVEAIRKSGGKVSDCLVVVSYGFEEAKMSFEKAGVRLWPLTDFPTILSVGKSLKLLNQEAVEVVERWIEDPWHWEQDGK